MIGLFDLFQWNTSIYGMGARDSMLGVTILMWVNTVWIDTLMNSYYLCSQLAFIYVKKIHLSITPRLHKR